jgi:hypothetical protein
MTCPSGHADAQVMGDDLAAEPGGEQADDGG